MTHDALYERAVDLARRVLAKDGIVGLDERTRLFTDMVELAKEFLERSNRPSLAQAA